MAKSLPISFKSNPKEMKMYEYVKSKTSASVYIKELIDKDMSGAFTSDMVICEKMNQKDALPSEITSKNEMPKNEIKLSSMNFIGR